jgi:hypothetical protein
MLGRWLRHRDPTVFDFLDRVIDENVPDESPDSHPFFLGSNPDGCTDSFHDALYCSSGFPDDNTTLANRAFLALYRSLNGLKNKEQAAYGRPIPNPDPDVLAMAHIIRDIFGNPFRPVAFSPEWRTDTVIALARTMYEAREFSAMPILADALQDADCESDEVLNHCRGEGPHVRGCWVVDLVLGKE